MQRINISKIRRIRKLKKKGKTNEQISEIEKVSTKTVGRYLTGVYAQYDTD